MCFGFSTCQFGEEIGKKTNPNKTLSVPLISYPFRSLGGRRVSAVGPLGTPEGPCTVRYPVPPTVPRVTSLPDPW